MDLPRALARWAQQAHEARRRPAPRPPEGRPPPSSPSAALSCAPQVQYSREPTLGRHGGGDRRPLGLRGWAWEGGGGDSARLGYTRHWTCRLSSRLLLRDSLVQDPPPPEQAGGTGSLLQAHTRFQAIPWKATPGFPRQDGPLGSQAVLTRDTEWATGAQGRPGGQGSRGRFPDWGTLRARSWLRQARPDRQPPSHLGQRAARGARGTEPVMPTSPSHPTSPAGGHLPSAQRGGRIHPDLQNWELRG